MSVFDGGNNFLFIKLNLVNEEPIDKKQYFYSLQPKRFEAVHYHVDSIFILHDIFYTSYTFFSRFVGLLSSRFLSFYLFLFRRILVRSCLLVAKIRYPPLSRYDPTDVPGKNFACTFRFLLILLFLIFDLLNFRCFNVTSEPIERNIGENSRESKKLPSKYGTPFNAHFSRDFPPGSGAINHRRTNRCSDQVYRANVRGAEIGRAHV